MNLVKRNYIFDFDSTLTRVEALDILAEITLVNNPKKDIIIQQIIDITNLGIDGEISFTESLERRIKLLKANKVDLLVLIELLKKQVSKSIESNKSFFNEYANDIYVISCGFKEFIDPIVKEYNIPSERVYANTFEFAKDGEIIGFDDLNVLSKHNGKIQCLRDLNLQGEIQVIGDGYSDYVTKKAGVADKFFAYTENISREKTTENADYIAPNLDEFLYVNKLPRNISYPKNRIKILLLENVHIDAFEKLSKDGFTVEVVSKSLSEEELIKKIKDVHVLGIRSKTKVTKKVIAAAEKLMTVGAFCIGTKQIDLESCKENGIVVFNAPYSNTRSVVELAIGEIIMLLRSVFQRSTELHNGQWNKTAQGSREVRGKKIGIIGYGNIGKQLSILSEALGMSVFYYDIEDKLALGNATKVNDLSELLSISDVVTLHIDDNASNKNFFGEKEISQMKEGSVLVNLSRGFVVDILALKRALESGKISGAAVDVYPEEPAKNGEFITELKGLKNVILTPHVGGSTEEAQKDIADFVPNKMMAYINSGNTVDAVNFPNIRLPRQTKAHRFLHIHQNMPGVMAQINIVLAKFDMNITGQYLSTDDKVGYVITDLDKGYNQNVLDELRKVVGTIKFRVLY
ncbi:MAG: D-3-phosphoglycerate dehydrogenase [Polaribacter sp. SA4-10]|nr:MAG: D-3-phosphoglycerate dehydrogenase [Polaribacter sp. SA4-10]